MTVVELIDWEGAGVGDPRWDVAGVIAQVLSEWLASMPMRHHMPMAKSIQAAEVDLTDGDRFLAEFWHSYRSVTAADESDKTRAFKYAAARLLQFACEYGQHADRVSGLELATAQVASNILRSPARMLPGLFPTLAGGR